MPGSENHPFPHKLDQSNISVSGFDAPPPVAHIRDLRGRGWWGGQGTRSRVGRQFYDEILQFQLSVAVLRLDSSNMTRMRTV